MSIDLAKIELSFWMAPLSLIFTTGLIYFFNRYTDDESDDEVDSETGESEIGKEEDEKELTQEERVDEILKLFKSLEKDSLRRVLLLTDPIFDMDVDKRLKRSCVEIEDEDQFIIKISRIPAETPITLIVHSDGGSVVSSDAIVKVIRVRNNFISVVPVKAYSAASLISLATQELTMGPYALMSPYDPQLDIHQPNTKSQTFSSRVLMDLSNPDEDNSKLHQRDAQIYHQENLDITEEILKDKYPKEVIAKVQEELCSGSTTHSKPYHRSDLEKLGLKIGHEMDPRYLQIIRHFRDYMEIVEFDEDKSKDKNKSKNTKKRCVRVRR